MNKELMLEKIKQTLIGDLTDAYPEEWQPQALQMFQEMERDLKEEPYRNDYFGHLVRVHVSQTREDAYISMWQYRDTVEEPYHIFEAIHDLPLGDLIAAPGLEDRKTVIFVGVIKGEPAVFPLFDPWDPRDGEGLKPASKWWLED